MYNQYNVLPSLPGRDPHFASPLPPPKHNNDRLPLEQNRYEPNPQSFMNFLSYIQTLDERSQRRLKIWKFDQHQNLLGFGRGTKQMMRFIARHLRELHTSFNYCSDLLNRVLIQLPYFRVIFPCDPICTVQFNDPVGSLTAGIVDDTHQFREMVSLLLRSTPELINLSQPLPIDFQLFFSKFFSYNLRLGNIERVKEFSYYVLFHPITHSYRDRMTFIHTIVFYRDLDPDRFDHDSSLESPVYGLQYWKDNYPSAHFLHNMVSEPNPIGCGPPSSICCTCWLGCPPATREGACWKSHIAWVLRRWAIYKGEGKPQLLS
jgi:hypothetical protein